MKALSICQPWAWAILHAGKRVENRTWRTPYRGQLLIHASKSRRLLTGDYRALVPGLRGLPTDQLPFGALVGVVELVDCVPFRQVAGDPFAEGPWCWLLADPRPLPALVPWKGRLGLFDVEIDAG